MFISTLEISVLAELSEYKYRNKSFKSQIMDINEKPPSVFTNEGFESHVDQSTT